MSKFHYKLYNTLCKEFIIHTLSCGGITFDITLENEDIYLTCMKCGTKEKDHDYKDILVIDGKFNVARKNEVLIKKVLIEI